MKNYLCMTIATAFGIGHIPGAPGTYASLATVVVFSAFWLTGRFLPALHLSTVCLISLAGILSSGAISRSTGEEDPQFIVIDEVAGQLLTFLFLPISVVNLVLGFIVFRVFDMWKPFPIRKLEPLEGGVGVMADDLAAGVYANALMQLLNVLL